MSFWKPSTPEPDKYEELAEEVRVLRTEQAKLAERVARDSADMWKYLHDIEKYSAPSANVTEIEKKLAVLDTWRAQLHSLLVERGNTGKEKLSRTGNALAKFYGRG